MPDRSCFPSSSTYALHSGHQSIPRSAFSIASSILLQANGEKIPSPSFKKYFTVLIAISCSPLVYRLIIYSITSNRAVPRIPFFYVTTRIKIYLSIFDYLYPEKTSPFRYRDSVNFSLPVPETINHYYCVPVFDILVCYSHFLFPAFAFLVIIIPGPGVEPGQVPCRIIVQ